MIETEKKTVNDLTVKVGQVMDTSGLDPRENDNLGKMICWHSRYDLGDKHDIDFRDYESWDDQESKLSKELDVAVMLPLYLYDHSGITMNTTGFHCKWDSGQVGWIYATKEMIRENWNIKRVTQKYIDKTTEMLVDEIKTYDQFIRGEIYEFQVLDKDEEVLDSCTGFYDEEDCMNEAVSFAENYS